MTFLFQLSHGGDEGMEVVRGRSGLDENSGSTPMDRLRIPLWVPVNESLLGLFFLYKIKNTASARMSYFVRF